MTCDSRDTGSVFEQTYASISTAVQDVLAQYRMPTADFDRICALAAARGLPLLSKYFTGELDQDDILIFKQHAEDLVTELQTVRAATNDADLHRHLGALAELADRLAALPSSVGGRLTIESGWISRWAWQ
ncbi:MAG: hypothetical protein GY778_32250 [bacterium]|nr:hypothetical protein [bacterium]